MRGLFGLIWRRRKVVLYGMGVGLALALTATMLMTSKYTSISKIVIEARLPQTQSQTQIVPGMAVTDQAVNSVVSVIESNVLIGQAINRIGMDKLDALDPASQPRSLVGGAIDAIRSVFAARHTGPALLTPEQAKMQRLTFAIMKDLRVSREVQSNVIDIAVTNPNRVLATTIANALAAEFVVSQVQGRRQMADEATKGLQQRLDTMRTAVEKAETAVDQFRAAHLISDGGSLGAATQQLSDLNNQLVMARADRISAEAAFNRLKEVRAKDGVGAVSNLVTSPTLESLNVKLMDLQRQDMIWAQNYGPQHPERVRLAGEIKGVKTDIAAEVQKIYDQKQSALAQAELREQTMQDSISALEKRAVVLSQNTIGLRQLQRVADSAQKAYDDLLARVNEARTEAEMQQPMSRVIEQATVPTVPSSPKTKLMAIIGLLGGLTVGFGILLFQEMTSPSYSRASELEADTGLPVLASVPAGDWKTPADLWAELEERPHGMYAERIRQVRTGLLVKDGKTAARSVLVCSSVPDEGKTTTTLALARMAAAVGKKVIVVDADLRRPGICDVLDRKMGSDFVDFLADRCPLTDAIYREPKAGFDILGPARPQPKAADTLDVAWLRPLIASLKSVYDLVLVDAPASLAVADATILGQAVDECVYIVRWHATPRDAVAKGLAQLTGAGAMIGGLVLTHVDPQAGVENYAGSYEYSS